MCQNKIRKGKNIFLISDFLILIYFFDVLKLKNVLWPRGHAQIFKKSDLFLDFCLY